MIAFHEQDLFEGEPEQSAPPVGELITSRDCVPPETRVAAVAELFFSRPSLEAIAVVSGGRPLALAGRNKLLSLLFRGFGFELFGRDPIMEIADGSPLKVSATDPLDRVLDRAMARPYQDIYDEIVVTDGGGMFQGLLSVKRMVVAQGRILSSTLAQRETALLREREMKKVSALKSRFLAHVTHELRSPVNAIVGLAEVARLGAQKECPDILGEPFELLAATAVNLRTLITNILDLSRIEAGRMEALADDFDLVPLLKEVAETTRILTRGKEITVSAEDLPSTLPLRSDPVKVRQIVTNLADNAAKFTDRGAIVFSLRREGDNARLSVSDTGPGIRDTDMEKLFSRFTQLEDGKTRRHEGSGLGLTITRELAHLLGGEIEVESVCGRGSTFTVALPLQLPIKGDSHGCE